MGKIKISDNVIWISHIEENEELAHRIATMTEGEIIELEVDGFTGFWRKMKTGSDGRPTHGIKPRGEANKHWMSAQLRRGQVVPIHEVKNWD